MDQVQLTTVPFKPMHLQWTRSNSQRYPLNLCIYSGPGPINNGPFKPMYLQWTRSNPQRYPLNLFLPQMIDSYFSIWTLIIFYRGFMQSWEKKEILRIDIFLRKKTMSSFFANPMYLNITIGKLYTLLEYKLPWNNRSNKTPLNLRL